MIVGLDRFQPIATAAEAASIRAAGCAAVGRYIRNMTLAEAQLLSDAALKIIAIDERAARRALQGYDAGLTDARAALHTCRDALSQPKGSAIVYAATDWSDGPGPAIREYARGYRDGLDGYYRTCVYGGGGNCHDLRDVLHLADLAYEAGAGGWPGSKDFTNPDIQQYPQVEAGVLWRSPSSLGEVVSIRFPFQWDPITIVGDEFGGWSLPVSRAPDVPPSASNFIPPPETMQRQLAAEGFYHGAIDGLFGPLSCAALQAHYRKFLGAQEKE